MLVSDGATLDRLTATAGGTTQAAWRWADTVAEADRMHANDRVYVTLLDRAAQAVLDSGALESIPLSMANVLAPTAGRTEGAADERERKRDRIG